MSTKITLSKRGRIFLIVGVVVGILVLGGGGYLLWRVNQEETVAPVDSEAGNNLDDCTDEDIGKSGSCDDGTGMCARCECQDGVWIRVCLKSGQSCTAACDECGHGPEPPPVGCTSGSHCTNKCYWPNVSYCNSSGTCICKRYDSFSNPGCGESTPSCTPTCPTGYEKCTSNCGTNTKTAECQTECPECKNQYYYKITCKLIPEPEPPNVCDGGIGIAGYGEDSDGIDPTSVNIAVDGEAVGSVEASVDSTDATKTNWNHTISGLEEGEHTVVITWKDTKGLGGSACTLTSSFSVEEIPTNPNWEIEKIGTPACEEGATDDLDKVKIAYVLIITNTGDGEGTIESIVDTLDDKVEASFLVDESITNDGKYSEGVITWTLTGEGAAFDPAESKTYQYSLMIPRVSFGVYENRVIATPTEGDSFSTIAAIQADCSITPKDIPETGLFDDASKKIALGFTFLALGMLYMKFDFVKLAWEGTEVGRRKITKRKAKSKEKKLFVLRNKFEKKVVKDK